MQNAKKKAMATMIALFLIFAMATSLVAIPDAKADSTKASYPIILCVPNPVGAGQPTLIQFGATEGLTAVGEGWTGYVTIERPDGTSETLSGLRTESTGIGGVSYTPTMEGTYYLQYHFDEQAYNWSTNPRYVSMGYDYTVYKASVTEKYALNVTVEPAEYYPGFPLPTEYWTRPIDMQQRGWWKVTGDWLMAWSGANDRFVAQGNEDAPETAHILWDKALEVGGLAGGDNGDVGFEMGDAYEGFLAAAERRGSPVIIGGRLFYNRYKYWGADAVEQRVVCVDLHTGEELWVRNWNNTRLAFGQAFFFESWNYQGVFPYLWTTSIYGRFGTSGGGTWDAYDAFTGRWVYQLTDMPQGKNVYGPHGEIYRYYLDLEDGWMMLWNSSYCVTDGGSWGRVVNGQTYNVSMDGWETHPRGGGWMWNKTIPAGLPGSELVVYPMDRIIGAEFAGETTHGALGIGDKVEVWGINVKPGHEGAMLFETTWDTPMEWILGNVTINMTHEFSWMPASLEDKVGIIWIKELKTHYGFSLDTGELLWGPSEPTATLDYLEGTTLSSHVPAYGNLYTIGVGGTMYCFDIKTGETLWTYDAVDPYTDFLYGNNWWLGIMFITDGKVYMAHGTHAALMPLPRGAPFICLNATSGEEIWRANGLFRLSGWGGHAIIGDGIIATHDTYSQRVFGVGKGPSATTASIQDDVVTHGDSVLVTGMVTDISPGTEEYARTARFPNGVPAVADEVMSDWMLYVYKQFPCPSDAAGVEVVVEVLDPNYNYYEVARTTSDPSGGYKVMFEPPVPGEYTIYATFEGSKAYYGSYAVTYLNVEDAPAATPAPTPTPAPMTDTYVLGIGSAILIAVIIGFVVLILIFRKR